MSPVSLFLMVNTLILDFCLAQPRIKIDEYAFKDSDISITCDTTRAKLRSVGLIAGRISRHQLYTLGKTNPNGVNKGRSIKLLSNPNNLSELRLNMINVQCSDARDYACVSYSDVKYEETSDFKILKVLELPSSPPPVKVQTIEACRGIKQDIGLTFHITCSTTVPLFGSTTFVWYHKDYQSRYGKIKSETQRTPQGNLTNSRRDGNTRRPKDVVPTCSEGQSISSKIDFKIEPHNNYGPNLIIKCAISYISLDARGKFEAFGEIEVCPKEKDEDTAKKSSATAIIQTRDFCGFFGYVIASTMFHVVCAALF